MLIKWLLYELYISLIPYSFKTNVSPKNIQLLFEIKSDFKKWNLKIKLDFSIASTVNSASYSKSFNLNEAKNSFAFGVVDTYKCLVKNDLILNNSLIFEFNIIICGFWIL